MANKKKVLTQEQKLAKLNKSLERKAIKAQEEKAKKDFEKSRSLMMSAMLGIVLATIIIVVSGITKSTYSVFLNLFAYGLTFMASLALIFSAKHINTSSKRMVIVAGVVACIVSVVSFIMQILALQ